MIRIYHDERKQIAETGYTIGSALDQHRSNIEVLKKFRVGMNVCMTSTRRSGWPDMYDTMYQYGTVTGFRDHGSTGKVLVTIAMTQNRADGRPSEISIDVTDTTYFTIEVL